MTDGAPELKHHPVDEAEKKSSEIEKLIKTRIFKLRCDAGDDWIARSAGCVGFWGLSVRTITCLEAATSVTYRASH